MKLDHATGLCGGNRRLERGKLPGRREPARSSASGPAPSARARPDSPCRRNRGRSRARPSRRWRRHAGASDCAPTASAMRTQRKALRSRRVAFAPSRSETAACLPCSPAASMPKSRSAVGAMSMSAGSSVVDRSAAEEHAGNKARVDAVVATPGLGVVLEHRPRDDARRRVPRVAIAGVVADDKSGAFSRYGPEYRRAVSNTSVMPTSPQSGSTRPLSRSMISAFSASASSPGLTMPAPSRPARFRNMPVRPSA